MALAEKDIENVYCAKCKRTGKLHDDCSRYTRELYQETEARAWSDRYVKNKAFYYEKQQERDAQLRALGIEPWGERRIDMNESKPYFDPYSTLMKAREASLQSVVEDTKRVEVLLIEAVVNKVEDVKSECSVIVDVVDNDPHIAESDVFEPLICVQLEADVHRIEDIGVTDCEALVIDSISEGEIISCCDNVVDDDRIDDFSSANEDERYEEDDEYGDVSDDYDVVNTVPSCDEISLSTEKMYANVQLMFDLALSNLEVQRQKGDSAQIASSQEFVDYLASHLPPNRRVSSVVESPISSDDTKFLIELGYYEHDSVLLRYIDLETRQHWIYVAHYNETISVIDMLNVICHSRGKKHRYKCVIMEDRDFGQLYDRTDYKLEVDSIFDDPVDEYFSDVIVSMNEDFVVQCPGFSAFAKMASTLAPVVYPNYCSVLYEVYPDSVFVIWDLQQFDIEANDDFGNMCGFDLKESAKIAIHYLARILSEFPGVGEFDCFVTDELCEQEMRRFWFSTDPVLYCDFDDDGFVDYSDHCDWLRIGAIWTVSGQMKCHLGAQQ